MNEVFIPNEYQLKVFDFIKNETGHCVVEAVAGSGKTLTILKALNIIDSKKKCAFVAFNAHIAEELKSKAPRHVDVRTLHSLGLKAVTDTFGDVMVDGSKVYKILRSETEGFDDWKIRGKVISHANKIIGLLKANLLEPSSDNIDDIIMYHNMERPNYSYTNDLIRTAFAMSVNQTSVIDFDDMIFLPGWLDLTCEKYDYVMVDEAQDLNKAQLHLVLASIKKESRIIAVGDRNQCHPPGTLITLTGGKTIPIENIKVGMQVVSYHTGTSYFRGRNTQGRKVEEIQKRPYNDLMHNFSTGMRCTPNHRILVRWSKDTDYKHIVYLMRKGNSFKIGHANAIYKSKKNGRNAGLSSRCRHENADEGWILSIHESADESFIHEQIIQAQFGFAGTPFKSSSGLRKDQWIADRIYDALGDHTARAIKCLISFGRNIKYPMWNKIKVKDIGSGERSGLITRPHIIRACNFISGFHEMKIFDGTIGGFWEKVSVNSKNICTDVYSLKVQPTEGGKRLYIADNTVVHNSIYGFRGADVDSIPKIVEKLGATVLPLDITYRCPKSHVVCAQKFVPEIRAAPNAKEGKVISETYSDFYEAVQENDLVLCRNNSPLLSPCMNLIQQGRKASIRGREIGKDLISLIKSLKAKNLDALYSAVEMWEADQFVKYKQKNQNPQAIEDKAQCLLILINGAGVDNVSELIKYIETLFSDDKAEVVFSSIHKAKGLEADNVFILEPNLMPSQYATQDWEIQQEENIEYVAITRAKENLHFVYK